MSSAVDTGSGESADAGVRDRDFVQSVARTIGVIRSFDADHSQLTLSDVARRAGLTRAAARRFLYTLAELGYVRANGRLFELRPKVLELGYAYLSALSLPHFALPHMELVVETVHESCSLAVLDGAEVVYVARVPIKRLMTIAISVGTRFPAHATSMGRVLLAHADPAWVDDYLDRTPIQGTTKHSLTDASRIGVQLEQIRHQGYCVVDQELEEGLRSIAIPVHGAGGQVIAAMNVTCQVNRGDVDLMKREFLPALQQAERALAEDRRNS